MEPLLGSDQFTSTPKESSNYFNMLYQYDNFYLQFAALEFEPRIALPGLVDAFSTQRGSLNLVRLVKVLEKNLTMKLANVRARNSLIISYI